uniref:Uncharacterized protein n=1 Tax=Arion vulgaris TaxID=1028688 RepID=A0A0B7AT81_9EUPU
MSSLAIFYQCGVSGLSQSPIYDRKEENIFLSYYFSSLSSPRSIRHQQIFSNQICLELNSFQVVPTSSLSTGLPLPLLPI